MNFNLALICTDGRFVDAGAFRASCSLSPSGRIPHPASASATLGVAFSLRWCRDTSLEPAYPVLPGETQDVQKVGKSLGNAPGMHTRYSFKDPRNLGRGQGPGASGAGHQSKDTGVDMDTKIQRQAQML